MKYHGTAGQLQNALREVERRGGQAGAIAGAAADELDRLRALARNVCFFDWSDNDEDAVRAVDDLRAAMVVSGVGLKA